MKRLIQLVLTCLLTLPFSAGAVIIEDVVSVNNWFNTIGETESWTHDINDDGFSVINDTVNSAELFLDFQDDERDRRICFFVCITLGTETAAVIIEEVDFEDGGIFEIDSGLLNLDVGVTGLVSLNSTGLLDVSVTRLSGDFYLGDVTLRTDVTLPEPFTLALMGFGLAGLGFARQRKNR